MCRQQRLLIAQTHTHTHIRAYLGLLAHTHRKEGRAQQWPRIKQAKSAWWQRRKRKRNKNKMPNKPKTRTATTATTKCRLSAKGEWQQKQCKRNGNVDDDDVASVTNRYRWCVGPGWQKGGCGGWLQMGTWQTNSKLLSAYFIVYAYALPTAFFLFSFLFFLLIFSSFPSPLVLATLGFR